MNHISTIFFDIDNTLVNHTKAQLRAIETVRNHYFPNVSKEEFEREWLKAMQLMWDLFIRKEITAQQRGIQRILVVWDVFGQTITEKEAESILDYTRVSYEQSWEIFPNVLETLQVLKSKGYNLGILTNISRKEQEKKLQKFDVIKYFNQELFFVPEEVGFIKPDPEFFLIAQKKAKALASNILFIGDDPLLDIAPAEKLGWNTLLIDHFGQYPDKKSILSFKEILDFLNV